MVKIHFLQKVLSNSALSLLIQKIILLWCGVKVTVDINPCLDWGAFCRLLQCLASNSSRCRYVTLMTIMWRGIRSKTDTSQGGGAQTRDYDSHKLYQKCHFINIMYEVTFFRPLSGMVNFCVCCCHEFMTLSLLLSLTLMVHNESQWSVSQAVMRSLTSLCQIIIIWCLMLTLWASPV